MTPADSPPTAPSPPLLYPVPLAAALPPFPARGPDVSSVPFQGGFIGNTRDALVFLTAFHMQLVNSTDRRLTDMEKAQWIRSGTIFVFEEKRSGIKRWTDGKEWSPSRILQNFLIYRELDPDRPDRRSKGTRKGIQVSPARPSDSDPLSPDRPSQAQADTGAIRGSEEDWLKELVGSLRESSDYQKHGLMKKTITFTLPPQSQYPGAYHVISYYTPADVVSGALQCVSNLPLFEGLEPEHESLAPTLFRFPPKVDYDQFGGRRYVGESDDQPTPHPPPRPRISIPTPLSISLSSISPSSSSSSGRTASASTSLASRAPLPAPITASTLRTAARSTPGGPDRTPAKQAPRYDPYGVNVGPLAPPLELSASPPAAMRPTLVSHSSSSSVTSTQTATTAEETNPVPSAPASAAASTPPTVPALSPASTDRSLSVSPHEYAHAHAHPQQQYYYPIMHPTLMYPNYAHPDALPIHPAAVDHSAHGAPSPFYPSSAAAASAAAVPDFSEQWYAHQGVYEEERKPFAPQYPLYYPQTPMGREAEGGLMYPTGGYTYAPFGGYYGLDAGEGREEV